MAAVDELTTQRHRARTELATTLESLGDRVAPKKVAARAKADAAERVEAVRDRVSPVRVLDRQVGRLRTGWHGIGTSVIGSRQGSDMNTARGTIQRGRHSVRAQSRQAAGSTAGVAGAASDRLQRAPGMVRDKAEGNPILAGLVAFGGGILLASALEPTQTERRVARQMKSAARPLADEAKEIGQEMAENLKQSAGESIELVKQEAQASAGHVKRQAETSARRTKAEAKQSAKLVKDTSAGRDAGTGRSGSSRSTPAKRATTGTAR
jgi:hypothetical protein